MSLPILLGATLAGSAGAIALYVASPNQRLLKRPVARRAGLGVGGALILISLALYLTWAGPATAVFILFTLLMTVWSIVPVVAAYARRAQGTRR